MVETAATNEQNLMPELGVVDCHWQVCQQARANDIGMLWWLSWGLYAQAVHASIARPNAQMCCVSYVVSTNIPSGWIRHVD